MWITDTSVKRPVLATVINLLLLVFGLFGLTSTSVREYPDIDPPIVSISTTYAGASAAVVETQITQLIEDRVAGIEGIKTVTSSSRDGRSQINVEFELSRNIDDAANDVRDRVSSIVGRLPDQVDPPEIAKADADSSPIIWFVLTSDRMDTLQLTDYAERYLVDRFSTIDGVSQVRYGGDRRYAMRVWLDRGRLAARGLTAEDIENALRQQNIERPAGRIESAEREFGLRTARPFRSAEDFNNLVIARGADGFPVRLSDVATVELGPQNPRGAFRANGAGALGIGIVKTSTANTLTVAQQAKQMLQEIGPDLPEGMKLEVNYDTSSFIEASLREVELTLVYAALFVIVVIFLFLGNARATLIPAITVPISLLASFIFLHAFGFSINILTLLALVLAIGLVVDDAIVMVENIHRRIELGESPLLASYRGAREVGFAIVAVTAVLVAVFVPIGFLEGNIGRLFREFALALAGSVICSAVVALTLSPALSAALLRKNDHGGPMGQAIESGFERLSQAYGRTLGGFVRRPVFAWVALAALGLGTWGLFHVIPQEFAPSEDRGGFLIQVTAPEGASLAYTSREMERIEALITPRIGQGEVERVMLRIPAVGGGNDDVNNGNLSLSLVDWKSRERSSAEIGEEYSKALRDLPGVRAVVNQRAGFGQRGGASQPVQVVLGGNDYGELAEWRDRILSRAGENPGLQRLDSDYKETKPQIELDMDLGRAGDRGVSVSAIATALETFMGGRVVTRFEQNGEEYDIVLQAPDEQRRDPQDLSDIYVRSQTDGSLVPLTSLVALKEKAAAATYNRVDRLRSITISASLAPGYTLGQALAYMEDIIREELPQQVRLSYKGESRDFKESSSALLFTFGMALLIVYLALAAQFESFVHPLVIMTTVPLAVFGALGALWALGITLNVYAQIGIVMLIGLAAKNGILIVEFANQQRDAGRDFEEALMEASRIRLRPILMTSVATMAGAVPLIFSTGAGHEARAILGIVILFGVLFSTVLTLYVVPAFYSALCRATGSPGRHAARLAQEESGNPEPPQS
ncbi:efflux RND transporter permease subunit [Solimonas sp. SE-A11]|uniref:efflux RND transporter permease subunit n=1 Tax=Solimonas sp. SE-A11 TaxID=3054954 RepID=UPI00259C749D|nr:efflux RND transporter permease subunit [Solimonas sp. SE-A11]MDM4771665.1 efflux RND transporter permease subunit [Solimonas sp. SE-A11]